MQVGVGTPLCMLNAPAPTDIAQLPRFPAGSLFQSVPGFDWWGWGAGESSPKGSGTRPVKPQLALGLLKSATSRL